MNSAQKVIKYFAIAFAISLIAGIFVGIYQVVGNIGNIFISNSDTNELNIKDYPNTSNILSINIGASKLKIVESEYLKIESDNKYITSIQEYNKLIVTEKSHSIFDKKDNNETIIYVPKGMIFDKVYISNGAGIIDIENIEAKDLKLELGAGKLEIDKITTYNNTEIEGGVGKVKIKNAKLNNLDLEVGIGKFTLDASITGKSSIKAGIGELNINLLDSKDNYSIYTETGIGNIQIDGNSVKNESTYGTGNNKIDIEGGIGSVNIKSLNNLEGETMENQKIKLYINDNELTATLNNNSSSKALIEELKKGPITINMSDYANMEKVGNLGISLPRNDENITTHSGDLILYQANQFVIYYDTNNWSLTRLGKIDNINKAELKNILGAEDVTVKLSLD